MCSNICEFAPELLGEQCCIFRTVYGVSPIYWIMRTLHWWHYHHMDGLQVYFCTIFQFNINNLGLLIVHRKPTTGNSLLRWKSFHPPSFKCGIAKGQYLRACHICSWLSHFKADCDCLRTRFRELGYPNRVSADAYRHAHNQDCTSLLATDRRTEEPW